MFCALHRLLLAALLLTLCGCIGSPRIVALSQDSGDDVRVLDSDADQQVDRVDLSEVVQTSDVIDQLSADLESDSIGVDIPFGDDLNCPLNKQVPFGSLPVVDLCSDSQDKSLIPDQPWSAGTIYRVSCQLSITEKTLNIEAGTIVVFSEGARLIVKSSGGLVADGTTKAIQLLPESECGTWRGLYFRNGANLKKIQLKGLRILRAGGVDLLNPGSPAAVVFDSGVQDFTFESNLIEDALADGVLLKSGARAISFSGNKIQARDYPITAHTDVVTFIKLGDYSSKTPQKNAIRLFNSATAMVDSAFWENHGIPYFLEASLTFSGSTVVWNIAQGTTIRVAAGIPIRLDNGAAMIAPGVPDSPIVFESADTEPWGGLLFQGANCSKLSLEELVLKNAGVKSSTQTGALIFDGCGTVGLLKRLTIDGGGANGVLFINGSRPNPNAFSVLKIDNIPGSTYLFSIDDLRGLPANPALLGTSNAAEHRIEVIGGALTDGVVRFQDLSIPYLFAESMFLSNKDGGTVLQFDAGVEVLFGPDVVLQIGDNLTLNVAGTVEEPVVFKPEGANWGGIQLMPTADYKKLSLLNLNLHQGGSKILIDHTATLALNVTNALEASLSAVKFIDPKGQFALVFHGATVCPKTSAISLQSSGAVTLCNAANGIDCCAALGQ